MSTSLESGKAGRADRCWVECDWPIAVHRGRSGNGIAPAYHREVFCFCKPDGNGMKPITGSIAIIAILLSPASGRAQSLEASAFAGFTSAAIIDRRAPEIDALDWQGGFTLGAEGGYFFTEHVGAEALWSRQNSGLALTTTAGTATLFTATTSQLHGNLVYRFGASDRRLRPFMFGGIGSTFFSADDMPSETKFSWDLGGGVTYAVRRSLGIRGHFRFKSTALADMEAGDFCDPFGFCQRDLQQIEVALGATFRF
jgi:opacity protein-like surface antigen